jgi:cell migration-inducing and hyaluronan-binding protein
VSFSITELDKGSWVIFELPGFNTAAAGTAVESLDALRAATATSYFKGTGSLWVKLVSNGDQIAPPSPATTLAVSR